MLGRILSLELDGDAALHPNVWCPPPPSITAGMVKSVVIVNTDGPSVCGA